MPASEKSGDTASGDANPIQDYFDRYREGPGIWKWKHYFEIYHRHFAKFVGKPVNVMEIGVYSGGSLDMWREYFGSQAQIIGVDIEPACKTYENDFTKIFIGDQGDRAFWDSVLPELPPIDVIIDDGGHGFEQQRVTLNSLWETIRPGGVYLCEDVHGEGNKFTSYMHAMAHLLNSARDMTRDMDDPERRLVSGRTDFQRKVHSIHQYPFVAVIEMNAESNPGDLIAPKRGTSWQPFIK